MNRRLLGYICVGSVFAASLLSGLTDKGLNSTILLSRIATTGISPENLSDESASMDDENRSLTAALEQQAGSLIEQGYSWIRALNPDLELSSATASSAGPPADHSTLSSAHTRNVRLPQTTASAVNRAFAFSHDRQAFLNSHSADSSPGLSHFDAVLRPGGFQRPHWQDLSFDADLDDKAQHSRPFLVVIDPGHGGSDPGTKGYNGLLEKDLTLDIARRVRLFLTELDEIDVRLTRYHDYGLSRQSRVDMIRRSGADMVISLHFNHLPQTDINLVETFYAGPDNIHESHTAHIGSGSAHLHRTGSAATAPLTDLEFTRNSKRLAHDLQQRVFAEVGFENTHAQNAGVKMQTLFVLTQSRIPGALLEMSCLSHAQEADKLTTEAYRNRLAAALVDGIRNYHDSVRSKELTQKDGLDV